jgi:hypothetical protein
VANVKLSSEIIERFYDVLVPKQTPNQTTLGKLGIVLYHGISVTADPIRRFGLPAVRS